MAEPALRHAGLDRLKAGLTLLVVFHHTAITYGATGGWFYREVQPDGSPSSLLLMFFCAVNQAYFMGLFFLLAGYFTPQALQHKGIGGFMRERLLRLGVPLLVFGGLLGPVTIAMAQSARQGRPFTELLLALWQRGTFANGPLWFAQALLIFSALAALWHGVWRATRPAMADASPFPSNRSLLLAALGCGALAFVLRLAWPVGTNAWGLQLGYFASYTLLFAAGCIAGQHGWLTHLLDPAPQAQTRRWRHVAWVTLPTLLPLALLSRAVPLFQGDPAGGWSVPALMYAFWEPFVAWGLILTLLSRAQRSISRAPSRLEQALARRAFCIYVIHPVVLVGLALAWREVHWPALVKFALTGTATCVVCYLVAGVMLRVPGVRRVL